MEEKEEEGIEGKGRKELLREEEARGREAGRRGKGRKGLNSIFKNLEVDLYCHPPILLLCVKRGQGIYRNRNRDPGVCVPVSSAAASTQLEGEPPRCSVMDSEGCSLYA